MFRLLMMVMAICEIASVTSSYSLTEFQPVKIHGNYNVANSVIVNRSIEYIILFDNSGLRNPFKVIATSLDSNAEYPVLVVVRQQKDVLSWQLPLIVETNLGEIQERHTSRTLCHNNQHYINLLPRNAVVPAIAEVQQDLIVAVSTASSKNVKVEITVTQNYDFYVQENQLYNATISASEPNYFYYKFPPNPLVAYQRVLLKVGTTYEDACFTVSVQNSSCPVLDLNKDITFSGIYQTVNTKGGITISQNSFPHGFFIVFVSKGDNADCVSEGVIAPLKNPKIAKPNQRFTVTFSLNATTTVSDFTTAALVVLGCIALFYVVFVSIILVFMKYSVHPKLENETSNVDSVIEPMTTEQEILQNSDLHLKDLLTKDLTRISNSSLKYLWHVMTVALFYGLPVVQLVITYQVIVNHSGNQDICYYNFLCAHPLADMSDFNHIYSNIGYCLLGLLFLIITFARQRKLQAPTICKNYGIPPHFGLSYAMGVALVIEGVLSACYHVCPNQSNYQFDTSFMYIMAVLCALKLYQNRHPGVNATAYGAFGLLGLAIFLAMLGILNAELYFWITFIIIYLIICFYVTIQVYYFGLLNGDYIRKLFKMPVIEGITPIRFGRLISLIIANLVNWAFAIFGILIFVYKLETDFATYLLGIFMTNTVLYMFFYVIMKIVYKENICLQPLLFLILSIFTWIVATYFFVKNSTLWTVSAAESRKYNKECAFMQFYDYHDIWHILSAPALFFSFMFLLTLDDDLLQTHHRDINVF